MKSKTIATLIIACATVGATAAAAPKTQPASVRNAVTAILGQYMPGTAGLGKPTVTAMSVDSKKRRVQVDCNVNTAYLPLSQADVAQIKQAVAGVLADKAKDYKISIDVVQTDKKGRATSRRSLDELALFAPKTNIAPTEKKAFVTDLGAEPAPAGLDGSNIALWQSHGWYFEPKLNRWEWQRARIFQTVEDLYTQSYVMPYLMPMLRNAGAYVMSPRERDVNTVELIIDNDGAHATGRYAEQGKWKDAGTGFAYAKKELHVGDNPFNDGTARQAKADKKGKHAPVATWSADFPEAGEYAVYVSYKSLPNSATDAAYTVNSLAGERQFIINQQMGGGTWVYLGHFPFAKGTSSKPVVTLTAQSVDKHAVVTADAVKIGGGMGNVARIVKEPLDSIDYQYQLSRYPRFTEGARYWLQWAGAPDSVYTPSDNVNDYTDDYKSRAEWVNWMAGGSSMLPDREGLRVPVDLSFAFHSDAGTTRNDSIIGTLGIYCTDGHERGDKTANGSSRLASRDLTNLVMTNIVDDVRRGFEPNWTRRGMWDGSYYEARVPEVPAMLLELLSHQNFADMKYGLDPNFRFTVARAIYKGMLQYLAHRDGREYVVTPLAPGSFAITRQGGNQYRLSWQATPDSLEATAVPTHYIIEQRTGGSDGVAFTRLASTTGTEYTVKISDADIHSYRIIAANDGGVSFPSEVLALCNKGPREQTVNIVNGFTRVSGPDWFEASEGIAGFYDVRDGGVPDVADISYIGEQFEFRRDIPWMDDDAAGFGASRSNYETQVLAGNTHDFVAEHGRAIAASGRGFVSTSVDAYVVNPLDGEPGTVDLILGKQKEIKQGRGVYGTRYKTFTAPLQDKIRAHTQAGGDIFVSGAFVATDLWDNPHSTPAVAAADQRFATEVLGYHWRVGQASVTGEAYQVPTRFSQFTGGDYDFTAKRGDECYAVESPDSFYAADAKRGCTFMRYSENNLVAGTAFDAGNYRTVVIGFPFETIKGANSRANLMRQVLNFFDQKNK